MIKMIKTAFLASAALAAVSTVVHADALVDLKSMLEKFNKNDAVYQAAVQVPDGYSIYPTADQPIADAVAAVEEPFTEVKVTGYIKAGYIYNQSRDGIPNIGARPRDASRDIDVEAGLNVKGSVQSSLGEVGITLQTKWDIAESTTNGALNALRDEGAVGFWQFFDTMKLEIGRSNAGRLENGIDKNTKRLWTFGNRRVRSENAGNGFFDRDAYNGFLGLAYTSGPLALNVRVHDATRGVGGGGGYDDDAIGASAKGLFTSEMINLEMTGGYWGEDDAALLPIVQQTGVKWLAGAGAELNFIPGIPVSLAVQTGKLHNDTETVNVSGSVGLTITDDITAGFGAGWKKISNAPVGSPAETNHTERVLHGEIYYAPLAQMIIGLEGDVWDDGLSSVRSNDGFAGAVVTRYSF
jgi:hypothetical protein